MEKERKLQQLTDDAILSLNQIIIHIKNEFGDLVAIDSLDEMMHSCILICKQPYIGTLTEFKTKEGDNFYKKVLHSRCIAFYFVGEDHISIALFWNTLQDSSRIHEILERWRQYYGVKMQDILFSYRRKCNHHLGMGN